MHLLHFPFPICLTCIVDISDRSFRSQHLRDNSVKRDKVKVAKKKPEKLFLPRNIQCQSDASFSVAPRGRSHLMTSPWLLKRLDSEGLPLLSSPHELCRIVIPVNLISIDPGMRRVVFEI
jgi:hypothetical protein